MQPRFPPPFPFPPGQMYYPGAQAPIPGAFPPQMGQNPMYPPMVPGAQMMAPGAFPMPYPMPMMMPPGFMVPGAVAPSGLASQVVVGAVTKAPTVAAPPITMSAPPAAPVAPAAPAAPVAPVLTEAQIAAANTSNILHKHIFCNAYAGLPVTLYIGKIPLDFEDARLSRILEVFGKVNRFIRPSDPLTLLPSSIAFVTYAQSICGLRCLNIFNGVNVDLEGGEQLIELKAGVKDSNILASVQNAETEAALMLPPGSSLKEIYEPMRENMMKILKPVNVAATQPSGGNGGAIVGAVGSSDSDSAGATANTTSVTSSDGTVPTPSTQLLVTDPNYYAFIDEELEEAGEKMLQSEIDKYRMRQNQRDVHVEQLKRQRIKQRVKEIQEQKRLEQLRAEQNANNNAAAEGLLNNVGKDDKKREAENAEELEAKRRRKQEVLRMLAGDTGHTSSSSSSSFAGSGSEPAREDRYDPTAAAGPFKLVSLAANKGRPGTAASLASVKSTSNFSSAADEDDHKPHREIIKIDYTEQEAAVGGAAHPIHDSNQGEDDEDIEGNNNYRKKTGVAAAPVVLSEAHAKALAQAQAISAAIANRQPIVDINDPKVQLKQMLDKIPTQRDELFAHPVNWKVLEQNNIINATMRQWIIKKMVEYLGEEEESLTGFIVSKLNSSCKPEELVKELSMVLDEDAEGFVLKLWRMLIYYSLKP